MACYTIHPDVDAILGGWMLNHEDQRSVFTLTDVRSVWHLDPLRKRLRIL